MRISDWSSDVCSSDLDDVRVRRGRNAAMRQGSRFAAVAFALLLAGCASSGGRSGDRAAVLDDARAHPENRLADAVACELTLASRSGEFPFAPFFAGLLDVPEAEGSRKFCAPLIEAVIAGHFSQADRTDAVWGKRGSGSVK